jgi:hypothetical protein
MAQSSESHGDFLRNQSKKHELNAGLMRLSG